MRVWGFPLCGAALIVAAAYVGMLAAVLLPLLIWTGILYVRCTREAIKHRHGKR